MSRHVPGASREVGYIQKASEVHAGLCLTIQDAANSNNDATLWTFDLTFSSSGPNGGRTITFGCSQVAERAMCGCNTYT